MTEGEWADKVDPNWPKPERGDEFVEIVKFGSQSIIDYLKNGFRIGLPQATCMSIPTVKKAKQLGYIGIYKAPAHKD